MRKAIAVFFHLPGLRLFYGFRPDGDLVRVNVGAVAATLLAMAASGWLAPAGSAFEVVFIVWLIGHMLWGAYLSTQLEAHELR